MKYFARIFCALALAVVAACGFNPVFAQGLQGPTAGSSNPGGGGFQAYIPAALGNVGSHFLPIGGAAPTLTAGCNGAGSSVDSLSTDTAGLITGQTAAATTCTVTFGNAYTNAPYCVVSGQQSDITVMTPSTTTLVVSFASTASFKFNYICFGK